MACNPENNVLSKVELVLPRNVIETCYMLPLGVGANFISTNITRATMTKIHVYKGNDESVKISVTGRPKAEVIFFVTCIIMAVLFMHVSEMNRFTAWHCYTSCLMPLSLICSYSECHTNYYKYSSTAYFGAKCEKNAGS